ncbi:MAG: S9 family peptidase [Bacteroidales bacterium]|jgi:dipeptidyl aminopeptidase/acylaminoacyl peptidase|nr:S9 family peptidase [Bacteroidales bacterium]MDD2570475.1 DPP IV N-terminal domain-containing protein [Bacteroidales bacterium]MDD3384251.1 DPP IV N-terminal domain-containing protein [Bacteroidales bacterium]MDD3811317.1 DPP IV N-terminal domain-containing protein [Bacteroidales bacterium]MDD3871428.1 DPP IV N-terminal domain-containing protein [Bacteroidales bacterium]
MKKTLLFLFTLSISLAVAFGQKADFRAAERYSAENLGKMVGSTSVRPIYLNDSEQFWYSYKTGDGQFYWLVDPAKKTKEPLFDNYHLVSEVNQQIHKILNPLEPAIRKLEFKKDNKSFTFEVDSFKFEYTLKNHEIKVVDTIKKEKPKNDRWMNYNKDSTWIVFAKNHNLFLMKADDPDSTEYQLTTDGELHYSYQADGSDTTSTKRLRARAGWFKDNQKFYVTRSDSREVKDLWVINVLKNRPELETYKYAMPGDENVPQTELWVFDVEKKAGVKVQTEKWKDQTLDINLLGDRSDAMIFIRQDRTCAKKEVCLADTETGETKLLFSETDEPYFNWSYSRLYPINEGKEMIWWSERTGFGQFYLYDGDGNLKNQMTKGNFVCGNVMRIDTLARVLYFEAFGREAGIDPYFTMIYRVNFDGSDMQLLTPEDATHSFNVAKETNKYFVDTYSRADLAPVSVLRDVKGSLIMKLEETDLRRLYETGWQMPERVKVKAVDGVTDLYGIMWKPLKMEEGRKYPIISYVYPGPQVESFSLPWSTTGRYNMALAQLGFVTVSMGHRGGSPMRDKYYHTYGYDNLRDYAIPDDKYALEQLADRYDFIDITKVGIYGHSGGGFMSTAAILTMPDFYDVAVSSAGNHDNNIYNLWWGETHHGVKEVVKTVRKKKDNNKKNGEDKKEEIKEKIEEGMPWYEEDSVKKEEEKTIRYEAKIPKNQELAKNLKGHLLLVHGDIDNNVHPGNSIRVADALITAGKRFDLMLMPGQRHGFGKYSKYFERMMWYYFAEHLLGDYRNNVEIYLPE